MYCKIFLSIYNDSFFKEYNLSKKLLMALNDYIKNDITYMGRNSISPSHFALEKNIDIGKSLRLFTLATKLGLFKTIAVLECDCGESSILSNPQHPRCSSCNKIVDADIYDNVYLYFELLYEIEECSFLYEEFTYDDMIDELVKSEKANFNSFVKEVGEDVARKLINEDWESSLGSFN